MSLYHKTNDIGDLGSRHAFEASIVLCSHHQEETNFVAVITEYATIYKELKK